MRSGASEREPAEFPDTQKRSDAADQYLEGEGVTKEQAAEAADMVERILDGLPPTTPREVGVARRLEGALLALRLRSGPRRPGLRG